MLFLENDGKFISGKKYLFKDFMHGEIEEVGNKIPNTDDLNTHLGTIFTCLLYTSPSPRDVP